MRGNGLLNDKLAFSCVRGIGEGMTQNRIALNFSHIFMTTLPHTINFGFADREVVK